MSDKAKKYYWLKLKEDFFDDDTISYIEEQENGVYYVNFYLKLCLKSLKAEGKLIRLVGDNLIPYDVNSLSKLTRTPVDTVRVAMQLFQQIGLVKVLETGEIYLSQMNELIGKETDKAAIMRRKRAQEKALGNSVTPALPECYTEIDIEIDKEKDIELDIEPELEPESPSEKKSSRFVKPTVEEVADYCKERNNGIDAQYFVDFYESKGWMVGKTKMKSWKASVRTWEKNNKERVGYANNKSNKKRCPTDEDYKGGIF